MALQALLRLPHNRIHGTVQVASDPYQEYLAALRYLEDIRDKEGDVTPEAFERLRRAIANVGTEARNAIKREKAG